MVAKQAVLGGLAAALLGLSGCVVAIGNESDAYLSESERGSRKIRLSSAEQNELPVVHTTADLPTVSTRYASELSAMGPQTTLDEFKRSFPTARFLERRESPDGPVDAYAVRVEEKYRYRSNSYGYLARDEKWFYFRNGHLAKWGAPSNWP